MMEREGKGSEGVRDVAVERTGKRQSEAALAIHLVEARLARV